MQTGPPSDGGEGGGEGRKGGREGGKGGKGGEGGKGRVNFRLITFLASISLIRIL